MRMVGNTVWSRCKMNIEKKVWKVAVCSESSREPSVNGLVFVQRA